VTNGVQAPRDVMQEWMLAGTNFQKSVPSIFTIQSQIMLEWMLAGTKISTVSA